MINKSKNKSIKHFKANVSFLLGRILVFAIAVLVFAADTFAQYDYEMTLNPRRLGNQLGVEVWVKTLNPDALPLGEMNIGISYNGNKLFAESNEAPNMPSSKTDAVQFDVDVKPEPLPYYVIESDFHNKAAYGFKSLYSTRPYGMDNGEVRYVAVLNVMMDNGPGLVPLTTGKGSFIGMLRFNILNANLLTDGDLAEFQFNQYVSLNQTNIMSGDGLTNLTQLVDFKQCQDFTIRGIAVLNPNSGTVNRYPEVPYLSMRDNHGYPVYFERSGLATPNKIEGVYGTRRYAYKLEYSLNDGSSYSEFGRVAENRMRYSQMTTEAMINANAEGMVDYLDSDIDYFMTTGTIKPLPEDVLSILDLKDEPDGPGLDSVGYGGVLRIIWKGDPNFAARSENAKFKITQIEVEDANNVVPLNEELRPAYDDITRMGASTSSFVLGRLFFAQLNGTCQYFRTARNFSTPSAFTVEAWVNLNGDKGDGSESGILAASSGSASSEEGGWMLYLQDGKYPAFRVRVANGGSNDYIGIVKSPNPLTIYATPNEEFPVLNESHSANWTHVAAVVNSNIVTLYVDGEQVDQVINNASTQIRPLQAKMPVWIGVNPNKGFEEQDFFDGGIKEVKVWRTALTQQELRQYIAGIPNPTEDIDSSPNDPRVALELYYTLQGTKSDVANEAIQERDNLLHYYVSCDVNPSNADEDLYYRPDGAHIKLTSPKCGEGVSNLKGNTYEVRWVSFGVGSPLATPTGEAGDVMIQLSRDGGNNWFDAISTYRYDEATGGTFALPLDNEEVEAGSAVWEPYNNVTITNTANDLQGVITVDSNYAKTVRLKVSGSEARNQQNVYAVSQDFTVAPHFALKNKATTQITIAGNTKLNITSQNSFIEAWIKPYSFPSDDEEAPFFPIIAKKDPDATTDEEGLHYALRLLPTGQLQFSLATILPDNSKEIRTATSESIHRIIAPNLVEYDSIWVHVGVYLSLPENGTQSKVIFYVDGIPQDTGDVVRQLGSGIVLDKQNTYPTYIGYENISDGGSRYFDGELREVRFWRNNPGGFARVSDSDYPNTYQLDNFIQGASTVRAKELGQYGITNYAQGLIAAYSMDGGSWVNNGMDNSIPAYPADPDLMARVYAPCGDRDYSPTMPFIKLVEPKYAQSVENTEKELRVRWVGFDYNRNDLASFTVGQSGASGKHADLGLSIQGGSGSTNLYYPPVASIKYNAGYVNAMGLPSAVNPFEFQGTASKSQFAAMLDLSMANPDLNKDLAYADQGNIEATAINGRLRLFARANINSPSPLEYDNTPQGFIETLMSESPSFTITPPSNFTLRLLLEGYHAGTTTGIVNNIGRTFEGNAVRIRLYKDNAGSPSDLIANSTKLSTKGYANWGEAKNIANRGEGTMNFANIPFVFTEVYDGSYYVVVDHQNYLPVMSAYPARFFFTGDDPETWTVESGWDFQAWNGADNHYMLQTDANETPVYFGTAYTAYAADNNFTPDRTSGKWNATGLNFNAGGVDIRTTNGLPALVGGDVVRDGQINATDRASIRNQSGSTNPKYDLTGKGYSNAVDRTIVDHNTDKISSIPEELKKDIYPVAEAGIVNGAFDYISDANPLNVVSKNDPEFSLKLIQNAREYIENGGDAVHAEPLKMNKNSLLASTIEYTVSATPFMNGQYIDVPVYIQNTGDAWALANGTFAITYDPAVVNFNSMVQSESVIFDSRDDLGYLKAYTAPTANTNNDGTIDPVENTRSIEINFDAFTKDKRGQNVPATKTYLGTLRFNMLRNDESFIFNWSPICAVLDVDGVDLTGKGHFEVIKPIIINKNVEIVSPNGGETFDGGSANPVTWLYPNTNAQVFIEFSSDNGSSWSKINQTPIAVTAGLYNWITPTIKSTSCLVRITNANTGVELDRSDAAFAISIAPTEITRPASADPIYTAGAKDYIRWHSSEKVSVYFEYSEDGLNNWIKVTDIVSSEAEQAAWTVKSANTKSAHIRMVNAQNGDILAISEPFKILIGTVAITNPKKGDLFKAQQKTQIKWTSSKVTSFSLQVSTDGGSTWESIESDVKASNKLWNWTVPNVVKTTDKALVRAIYNNDPVLEYSRTGAFTIEANGGISELELAGFAIADITPNPVNDEAVITIDVPRDTRLSVAIYNAAGQKVAVVADAQIFSSGKYPLNFNAGSFAAGVYVVRMQVGADCITKDFVKIK